MRYFVVDAFADGLFSGNPAGICVAERPLDEEMMQRIAAENRLPETAFLYMEGDACRLRWFTPKAEIDLCGHATLAAAHVVMNCLEYGRREASFETRSGTIAVTRCRDGYRMALPNRKPRRIGIAPHIKALLGTEPCELAVSRDLIAVLRDQRAVEAYRPDYEKLQKLSDWLGIVVTAKGERADFVSRYFCPELCEEDPVTGSSHCSLAPYWAEKLGRDELRAEQLSARGGRLLCEVQDQRVLLTGKAFLYLQGEILTDG